MTRAALSLKKYLGHHALVFVAQQMTVEQRDSANNRIGEVHHQIGASFDGYLYRIQPLRMREARPVLGKGEKVNLMNVEGVDFVRAIHHSPVVKAADGDARHGRIRGTVFLTIDIEAILVLGERNPKIGGATLRPCNQLGRYGPENRG